VRGALGRLATNVGLGRRIMLRLRLVEARNDEAQRARVVVADSSIVVPSSTTVSPLTLAIPGLCIVVNSGG
jgi:hypothetical protein